MKKKRFLITLVVIFAAFFGSKFVLDSLYASQKDYTYKDDTNYNDNAINKEEGEYLILLVGVDKNSADDDNTDFTRTDTIMLVSANSKTGEMKLLSIPRDSRIKIREKYDKVNHAHAFGGIELTMQTLRTFLGLDIDYYVQVNYQALINIVDALGGVDYEVPEGVYVDKGAVQIEPGPNHLDGNEVMWLLRTRNIYNNGDIGRVHTQQQFVKAMVDEIVKKSKDMNIMTFISNYLRYVKTNLPMSALMDLAGNINKFSSDKMDTLTVPGMEETINGTSYWIPDYHKTWKIVDDNFASFKLENWSKEDSGYMEYEEIDVIEDQSQNTGRDLNREKEDEEPGIPIPDTQTIPMDNSANPSPSYQAPVENHQSVQNQAPVQNPAPVEQAPANNQDDNTYYDPQTQETYEVIDEYVNYYEYYIDGSSEGN